MKDKLTVFVDRLTKIGIDVTLAGNYPWIYLNTINGKRVTELYEGNHGFTVAWYPTKNRPTTKFTDITEIFKVLRKYTA